jgi:hypothetical protein
MDVTLFFDMVIGGLIMGGLYALIAVGLGLQYGVARALNVSHGEFTLTLHKNEEYSPHYTHFLMVIVNYSQQLILRTW